MNAETGGRLTAEERVEAQSVLDFLVGYGAGPLPPIGLIGNVIRGHHADRDAALAKSRGSVEMLLVTARRRGAERDEARAALARVEALHAGAHQCVGGTWWTDDPDYRGTVASQGPCPTRAALHSAPGETP